MIASERVLKAMYARLAGDATLVTLLGVGNRIHERMAPEGTSTPYIVLAVPSSVDLTAIGGARIWENVLVSATVWGKGLTTTILPAADRVDTLLRGYSIVVDNVEFSPLDRERAITLDPSVSNGVRFPAIFQEYRAKAHEIAA